MKKKKIKHNAGYYAIAIVLLVCSLVMILPLYWMIVSSFKTQTELMQMPPTLFPTKPVLTNYARVFEALPFLKYYANSIVTSLICTVVSVFTSCIIG
ncbi:MAG: carbohydrate ABC transporter permease, partial [Oscillospiraceae bacterium]